MYNEAVQVQRSNIIGDNEFLEFLKVHLEKWRPLHAKNLVVLVAAEQLLKVLFRPCILGAIMFKRCTCICVMSCTVHLWLCVARAGVWLSLVSCGV